MNKIELLIHELCPEGIKRVPLWEITNWDKRFNGVDSIKQKIVVKFIHVSSNKLKSLDVGGPIKLLSTGKFDGYTNASVANEYINFGEVIAIPSGGSASIKYFNGKFVDSGNILAVSSDIRKCNLKYVFYYLLSINGLIEEHFRGSGVKHPDMKTIIDFKIPLPPFPIQEEIVRILDDFTDDFTELEAELDRELNARTKQYEYYLNKIYGTDIFNMKEIEATQNIKLIALENVGTFRRGKRFVRGDIVNDGIPCIHYGDLYTHYGVYDSKAKYSLDPKLEMKMRYANKDDVIIVQAGENLRDIGIGVAWLGEEKIAIHDALYIFTHNQNPKYISYFLRTSLYRDQISPYVSHGKIFSVNSKGLGKAQLLLPPIEKQNEIVKILDQFSEYTSSISQGLHAEIELRLKQYEYYRNKLLTF